MAERESAAETTEEEEQELLSWNRETVPRVLKIVVSSSTRGGGLHLSQKDLISLLLVSPWLYRTLVSYPSLWLVLDFHEMSNSGDRLLSALSLERYKHVKHINLEFARDVGDEHFEILKSKCFDWLQSLESINLNGCQKISDKGIEAITTVFHSLKFFSIYWNVRVTDIGVRHLVRNCKHILDLNLSGCKNISDETLQLIADNYRALESLDITRCVKLTDTGLCQILLKCSSLRSLNLYALSSFTDRAYNNIASLGQLRFLDLCGAQNLTDEGLSCIAKCKHLVSLNLTWCVRVTDKGVNAIAHGCTSLEFLSLFGIIGVTDKCLELLSRFCSSTLTTLDVNGCIGIKRRSREELLKLFPHLRCFKVHS